MPPGTEPVDAIISRYQGSSVAVSRLIFAARCPSLPEAARAVAARAAVAEVIASGTSCELYVEACALPGAPPRDLSIEESLRTAGTSRAKEAAEAVEAARTRGGPSAALRIAYRAAAAAAEALGPSSGALAVQWLTQVREHVATAAQAAEAHAALLRAHLLARGDARAEAASALAAAQQAAKLAIVAPSDAAAAGIDVAATVHAAKGLLALRAGAYALAATEFLRVPSATEGVIANVIHVDDVAMYALLTALATRSRDELRDMLGDATLHSLLELAPAFRDAVQAFVMTKYAACLGQLHALEASVMAADLYLAPHARKLIAAIRRRSLKHYLAPYVTVDLRSMAAAFCMPAEELEDEVAELIAGGELSMRIDAHAMRLCALTVDARSEALSAALDVGKSFVVDSNRMLLRAAMELDGLCLPGGGGGGGKSCGRTATAASADASAEEDMADISVAALIGPAGGDDNAL